MWDFPRKLATGRAGLALLFVALGLTPARADILYLRDGSRHYGELVSEDRRETTFRVVVPGGASSVRKFATELVVRIERTPETAPPAERADAEGHESLTAADFEQSLREAYELLDDGDRPAAQRALQRLVTLAPAQTLNDLNAHCQTARGRSIDELLAAARLDAALHDAQRERPFRLRGVTRFEAEAMGVLLEDHATALLDKVYSERAIREWATGVIAYDKLKPDSRRLVADARLAAALITARIRHDPRLFAATSERKRLGELRTELTRFAASVMSLRGYTARPGGDDPSDEWLRARVGRGGTLLRSIPGAPTSQPATTRPDPAPRSTSEGERESRRPKSHFPEEDEP